MFSVPSGGNYLEVGDERCTHMVVEENSVKELPFSPTKKLFAVKQEVGVIFIRQVDFTPATAGEQIWYSCDIGQLLLWQNRIIGILCGFPTGGYRHQGDRRKIMNLLSVFLLKRIQNDHLIRIPFRLNLGRCCLCSPSLGLCCQKGRSIIDFPFLQINNLDQG